MAAFQHLATKAMALSSRRLGRPSSLLEFFVYDYGPETAICRWVYSRLGQGPVDEQVREEGREEREGGEGIFRLEPRERTNDEVHGTQASKDLTHPPSSLPPSPPPKDPGGVAGRVLPRTY